MAFIAFFVYLGVLLPAKNRLDDIDGISAAMVRRSLLLDIFSRT